MTTETEAKKEPITLTADERLEIREIELGFLKLVTQANQLQNQLQQNNRNQQQFTKNYQVKIDALVAKYGVDKNSYVLNETLTFVPKQETSAPAEGK